VVSVQLDQGDVAGLLAGARELAAARTLDEIIAVTCTLAVGLTDADGAKLVLRDMRCGDDVLAAFIATYGLRHREPIAIADLAHDDRVPVELIRTEARSILLVPVGTEPIAALGVYWTKAEGPTPRAVEIVGRLLELSAPAIANHQRLAAAERVVRERDELVSRLGQELRNALAPPVTALHLIKMRGSDPFERERTFVERAVQQAVRIIDDMLDVSRMARGLIQLRRTRAELAWIVERGIENARGTLAETGHDVAARVPADGLAIDADIDRMTQVVTNLVANAARHTPRNGTIAITGDVEMGCARLVVRDTGSGIEPSELPALFEPFAHRRGELGLGLPIVRGIVELHGGVVSAASDGPGRGSTFTIRLPLLEQDVPAVAEPRARGTRPLRVLVVDDNIDAARTLGELLQLMGHEPVVVHDQASALAQIESVPFEVAFLDIGLPVVDGCELAERMRALPQRAPLVAITGFARPADRQRARESGFDEHLVKPLSAEKLRLVIEKLTS
jgi:signal transduction histidine kinase